MSPNTRRRTQPQSRVPRATSAKGAAAAAGRREAGLRPRSDGRLHFYIGARHDFSTTSPRLLHDFSTTDVKRGKERNEPRLPRQPANADHKQQSTQSDPLTLKIRLRRRKSLGEEDKDRHREN
ncbi:hypothetical protein EYF80_034928 [Liparis tanakae]|uniref:Uncharacterized protein n=1 Tax=Liparis tanakae TaxID=230148 RepID=A0A4Z2GMP4_9TELE|nr:hypothetical protein EYF80_034928 [Liparis tanakae]